MIEFVMPRLGADMTEGKLVSWKVKPGDDVSRGMVIAEVDTAKGVIDVECFQPGRVLDLVAREGEVLPVGAVMARLSGQGESELPAGTAAEPAEQRGEVVVEAKENSPNRLAKHREHLGEAEGAPSTSPTSDAKLEAVRGKVSPRARRMARELGVELGGLAGTGADGQVTGEDVVRASAFSKSKGPGGNANLLPPSRLQAESSASQVDRMRQAIAAAMAQSNREIPHYYLRSTIDMQTAVDWLRQENSRRPMNRRLLPVVVGLKALGLALREVPELNGSWQEGGFRPGSGIHIGFAVALSGGGLVTPAIHDVDQLTLDEIMVVLNDLIPRARRGRLRSSELTDGTITLTSLGDLGVDTVWGVIYPPQVALIGMGRMALRPWVLADQIVPRTLMDVTLAADHRASDGLRGARLLDCLNRRLQSPDEL